MQLPTKTGTRVPSNYRLATVVLQQPTQRIFGSCLHPPRLRRQSHLQISRCSAVVQTPGRRDGHRHPHRRLPCNLGSGPLRLRKRANGRQRRSVAFRPIMQPMQSDHEFGSSAPIARIFSQINEFCEFSRPNYAHSQWSTGAFLRRMTSAQGCGVSHDRVVAK